MRLPKEILQHKTNSIDLLDNYVALCYEGTYVGDIELNDIDYNPTITMSLGDIIVLPKNDNVISSIKHGIIKYFSKQPCLTKKAPPLSIYTLDNVKTS